MEAGLITMFDQSSKDETTMSGDREKFISGNQFEYFCLIGGNWFADQLDHQPESS